MHFLHILEHVSTVSDSAPCIHPFHLHTIANVCLSKFLTNFNFYAQMQRKTIRRNGCERPNLVPTKIFALTVLFISISSLNCFLSNFALYLCEF